MFSSLADPVPDSSIGSAVSWVEGALLGSAAAMVAMTCVAALGMMMFSGRMPVRRGLLVVFGCFFLFGAPVIAHGLLSALGGAENMNVTPVVETIPLPSPLPKLTPRPGNYDPYAGASVPSSQR